ncbi:MAG: UDP-N-acetylmuramoyl-tripeptide--D-alanyl-D-alanine ligase [Anaerolineales bacterium]|nr:UDP-N-acetylmuramoyl-tripeptide--D-alanyl-D-alanine ligase [Anaerolineales bacterium]
MFGIDHIFDALTGIRSSEGMGTITKVVVDSRCAVSGSLFVAFSGESVDGHDFVEDAFHHGAIAALIEHPVGGDLPLIDLRQPLTGEIQISGLPVCLLVDNTLFALQQLAKYWRARFKVRVIGITGSVGKTTTKEVVYTVLGTRFRTLKSPGNLNNEIGLPLTLLNLDNSHQAVVLEMGMYARGEIATLADIACPQVGVVTNVGPVHLERLGSIQDIAAAKAELVEALPAAPDGVAILNKDEKLVRDMAALTKAEIFSYGLSRESDLWADSIESVGLEGIRFILHYHGEHIHIGAPLLGRHSVHTALRAAAVGLVEGLDWSDIVIGLQSESVQLRLVAVAGPNDSLLLDDTYNASPASTIAALNLLNDLENRKVAVLGDMLELGAYEEEGHRMVGRRVADVADFLVTVGDLGKTIALEAIAAGMPVEKVMILPDVQTAIQVLPTLIQEKDMVLLKASRGLRLDQLVDVLSMSDLKDEHASNKRKDG